MSLLYREPITRRRYLPDALDSEGAVVAGGFDDEGGTASVQPASLDALQVLPEGDRTKEARSIWTLLDLQTAEQRASNATQLGPRADLVRAEGSWWRVMRVARWPRGRLAHYEALVVRVQEGA